jgi:hypothetical protein
VGQEVTDTLPDGGLLGGSVKVSELEGAELDYWVARAEGFTNTFEDFKASSTSYSLKWEYGGLIIEREKIASWFTQGQWEATYGDPVYAIEVRGPEGEGPTQLTAAMRAFVRKKFGKEVEDAPLVRAD